MPDARNVLAIDQLTFRPSFLRENVGSLSHIGLHLLHPPLQLTTVPLMRRAGSSSSSSRRSGSRNGGSVTRRSLSGLQQCNNRARKAASARCSPFVGSAFASISVSLLLYVSDRLCCCPLLRLFSVPLPLLLLAPSNVLLRLNIILVCNHSNNVERRAFESSSHT